MTGPAARGERGRAMTYVRTLTACLVLLVASLGLGGCGADGKACSADSCPQGMSCNTGTGTCEPIAGLSSELTLAGPTKLVVGRPAALSASFDHVPGVLVRYRLLLDGEEVEPWSSRATWTFEPTAEQLDTHTLTAEAALDDPQPSAPDGGTDGGVARKRTWTADLSVTITAAETPMPTPLRIALSGPAYVAPGDSATYRAAVDAAGEALYFRLTLDGAEVMAWTAGTSQGGSAIGVGWTYTAPATASGTHLLVAEVAHAATGPAEAAAQLAFAVGEQTPDVSLSLRGETTILEGSTDLYAAELTVNSAPADATFEFRFFLDGRVVQDWSSGRVLTLQPDYYSQGSHTLSTEVAQTDVHLPLAAASLTIGITNVSRAAQVSVSGPTPVAEGISATYTALGTDPNATGVAVLYYRFWLDGVVVRDWSDSKSWVWNIDYYQGDGAGGHKAHTVWAEVARSLSGPVEDFATFIITVIDTNRGPAVSLTGPATVVEGGSAVFVAAGVDPDHNTLYYRFLLQGMAMRDWDTSPTYTFTPAGGSGWVGAQQMVVEVTDVPGPPWAAKSQASHLFQVIALGTTPKVATFTATPASPYLLQPVALAATGFDLDGGPVYFRFLVDGVEVRGWSPEGTAQLTPAVGQVGVHTVRVEVGPTMSGPATDSRDLVATVKPLGFTLTVPAGAAKVNLATTFTVTPTYQPTTDVLEYRFLLDGAEARPWSTNTTWTWTPPPAALGAHGLTVEMRAGSSATVLATRLATVSVTWDTTMVPTVAIVGPGQAPQNSSPSFAAIGADAEGQPLEYRWYVDNILYTQWDPNATTFVWPVGCRTPGNHTVKVDVRDTDLNVATASVVVAVTDITPPTVTLAVTPSATFAEGAAATFTATGADVCDTPLTYAFRIDGIAQVSSGRTFTWTPPNLGPLSAGPHVVTVTASDGTNPATASVSVVVTQVDLPPTVTLTGPASFAEGTWQVFVANASDPDGDDLLYRFLRDGSEVQAWSPSPQWFWQVPYTAAGNHIITAEVRAGLAPAVQATSTLNVTVADATPP
jgi:hypothetical protein